MPSWMPGSSSPSGQLQPLRFESDPPGAEVRTTQGQTCLTPCSITVPSEPQAVTITRVGFLPQTIQVSTGDPPDHSFWENPPPSLVPNPVQVVLQAVPPPPRAIHRRRPKESSRTRTAEHAEPAAVQQGAAGQPGASPFPPPPPPQH